MRKIEEGRKDKQNPRGWLIAKYNREQDILVAHGAKMAQSIIDSHNKKAGKTSNNVETPRKKNTPAVAAMPGMTPHRIIQPPGLLGDICGWINSKARKKQPLLTLGNALAFLGTLFGRKVRDEWDDLRTNIYCLGVGASSCGKDHSRRAIKDLCTSAGVASDLLGGEEVTSDTAIATALHDRPSCLCQWDEIGHMIASMKDKYASAHRKTIVPMLMKLYSSANTVYLGKEYASSERQDLVQPNFSIYGTTVPDTLWKGLSTEEIRDGFLSRMLVFISKDDDPDIDENNSKISTAPKHLIDRIDYWFKYSPEAPHGTPDIQRQLGTWQVTIPTSDDAQAHFRAFRAEVRSKRRKAQEQYDPTAYLWGRAEENARKVALIVAAGDAMTAESAIITKQHAEYACTLITHLLTEFIKAVGENIADSAIELSIKKVYGWIKAASESGLWRNVINNRMRNPRERNEAIDSLIKEGEIFEVRLGSKRTYFAPPHGIKHLQDKQECQKKQQ